MTAWARGLGPAAATLWLLSCASTPKGWDDTGAAVKCFHGLEPPYQISRLDAVADGATTGGSIQGAGGLNISFWYDNGANHSDTPGPRIVHLGGTRRHDPSATALESGSECESAFIEVLRRSARSHRDNGFERAAMRIVVQLEQQRLGE